MRHPHALSAIISPLLCMCLTGCNETQSKPSTNGHKAAAPSNRIDVPQTVRQNLGIVFTKVERRQIKSTLRLPAQVVLLPTATQHYRAPLAGRVSLRVTPLQRVKVGDLLYTLDSHEWRGLQRELGTASNALILTKARLKSMQPLAQACREHEASLREARKITTGYVSILERSEESVGGQGEKLAKAQIEQARLSAQIAESSEKHTETQTRIEELNAMLRSQTEQLDLLISGAASTLGIEKSKLGNDGSADAGWRTLTVVEVRATQDGIVNQIETANGNLVDTHGAVIVTIDPTAIRCHARALQSDIAILRDGLTATIVPINGGPNAKGVVATIQIGPAANARTRTLEVFASPAQEDVTFLQPGLAVFVEIVTATTESATLAIPTACVLPDGLDRVFFRRDPNDPDKVIRVVADLGQDNGQWVEVMSGIMDSDEIVSAGAFELVLASSSQTPKGGHFHADGTWHADGEDHE